MGFCLTNQLVEFIKASLAALTVAGVFSFDADFAVAQVVTADAKFAEFLTGGGGAFAVPLLGVAAVGSPTAGSSDRDMFSVEEFAHFAVYVAIDRDGGVADDEKTKNEIVDAIKNALHGRRPRAIDDDGDFLDADGVKVDDEIDAAKISHPLEYIGNELVPVPTGVPLFGWSVEFRTRSQWRVTRKFDADPDPFEVIGGVIGPVDDTQTEIDPDDETEIDAFDINFEP